MTVAGIAQWDAPFTLAWACYDRLPVSTRQAQALLLAVGTLARLRLDRASPTRSSLRSRRAVGLLHTSQKCTVFRTALSLLPPRGLPEPRTHRRRHPLSTTLCNNVIDPQANVRLCLSLNFFLVFIEELGNAALVVSRLIRMIAAGLLETDPDVVFFRNARAALCAHAATPGSPGLMCSLLFGDAKRERGSPVGVPPLPVLPVRALQSDL